MLSGNGKNCRSTFKISPFFLIKLSGDRKEDFLKKLKLINKVVDESQPNNIKNNLLEIVKELDTDYFESSAESNINSLLNSCSDMTLVIEVFLNNWLKDQTFFPSVRF